MGIANQNVLVSRRGLLGGLAIGTVAMATPLRVAAQASGLSEYERRVVGIALRERDRVGAMLARPDVVAIADFAKPSHDARLHFVDMVGGSVRSHLVAHGRGSDPAHVGWLKQFSNSVGSLATSRAPI
jgi:hypothetical protein